MCVQVASPVQEAHPGLLAQVKVLKTATAPCAGSTLACSLLAAIFSLSGKGDRQEGHNVQCKTRRDKTSMTRQDGTKQDRTGQTTRHYKISLDNQESAKQMEQEQNAHRNTQTK
jgi:hypothetical protein